MHIHLYIPSVAISVAAFRSPFALQSSPRLVEMAFVDDELSKSEFHVKVQEVEDRWQDMVVVASAMLKSLPDNRYTRELCQDIDKFLSNLGEDMSLLASMKEAMQPHQYTPMLEDLADKTYDFGSTWASLKEIAEQLSEPDTSATIEISDD